MQVYDVLVDVDHINPIEHKKTELNIFHVIRKNGKGIFNHLELARYIETKYYQSRNDYTNHEEHISTYKEYPTIECDPQDFGKD